MEIGTEIKKAREKAGLTQEELASKVGLSVTSIQGYEYGIAKPRARNLLKISKALELDTELLTEIPKERTEVERELLKWQRAELEAQRTILETMRLVDQLGRLVSDRDEPEIQELIDRIQRLNEKRR